MEKILLAIDAVNPDKKALDFACYLALLTKSKVTGVFLENLVTEEKPVIRKVLGMASVGWEVDEFAVEMKARSEETERNIKMFREGCILREVCFDVHHDKGVPAKELVRESRFADLIVVDAETSFNKVYEGTPTGFVREVMRHAECPVVIVPGNFNAIDEIVFTYDGSASSVFAIKQFTYLFPQYYNKKITILQVNESGVWEEPERRQFREWLQDHYTDLQFEAMKGKPDDTLFSKLFNRKNMFLVMGAYGRNAISQFFKQSSADLLIRTVEQPIFIAHQ